MEKFRNLILDFINTHLGILLLASIIFGYLFPQLAIFKSSLPYLLMFLLFSSFLNLDFKKENLFRKELLIYPFLNWVILPFIVYHLSFALDMNYRLGLFIIAIAPPAMGSPIISNLIFGNTEFVVSKVVLYNLLSPVTFALLPLIFFSESTSFATTKIVFLKVVEYIFIPLSLAILVRRKQIVKQFFVEHIKIYNGVFQLFMIIVAISSSVKKIHDQSIDTIFYLFISTTIIAIFLYFFGYLFCVKDEKLRSSCALSAGYKNTLLAMIICLTNFSPVTALPSIFYLVSHHILNGFLLHKAKPKYSPTKK